MKRVTKIASTVIYTMGTIMIGLKAPQLDIPTWMIAIFLAGAVLLAILGRRMETRRYVGPKWHEEQHKRNFVTFDLSEDN